MQHTVFLSTRLFQSNPNLIQHIQQGITYDVLSFLDFNHNLLPNRPKFIQMGLDWLCYLDFSTQKAIGSNREQKKQTLFIISNLSTESNLIVLLAVCLQSDASISHTIGGHRNLQQDMRDYFLFYQVFTQKLTVSNKFTKLKSDLIMSTNYGHMMAKSLILCRTSSNPNPK